MSGRRKDSPYDTSAWTTVSPDLVCQHRVEHQVLHLRVLVGQLPDPYQQIRECRQVSRRGAVVAAQ